MVIVVDTSVFLAVAFMEPERNAIIAATSGHEAVAPDILPYEMGNALVSMVRKGALHEDSIQPAWETLCQFAVLLRPVDIGMALDMAIKCRIYAYDAYFLACASSMRAPVLTLDKTMQRAARSLEIPVVEISS
jgi:predicted nucleic acid-binding protein